eukprot:scaffold4927_cov139-Amphora_coffeaeformis.AAC.6
MSFNNDDYYDDDISSVAAVAHVVRTDTLMEVVHYIQGSFFTNLDADIILPLLGGYTGNFLYPPDVNKAVNDLMNALVAMKRDSFAKAHWNPPTLYSDDKSYSLLIDTNDAFLNSRSRLLDILDETVRGRLAVLVEHCEIIQQADAQRFLADPNVGSTGFPNLQATAGAVCNAVSILRRKMHLHRPARNH